MDDLLSIVGFMVGNVSTFPLSAALCRYGPLGGWKTIFYTLGKASTGPQLTEGGKI